ncbi:hypothetical protein KQ693_07160 [Thermus sp. PS18]|uniref:hypothetical protein n=1 Tax=Thermus sp. PS18 TaxID=2849039 RepID=UPI002264C2C6|nr:hypothetical protein [Thermus sp. PS18]UZX14418.1 hypothetical protein KQ693_07160 [Thermus sp. PS18]
MEVLGNYWLRRILARIASVVVYEGQDTHTGMPVMVLKGAQGVPALGEGVLPLLEETPEAWVLEWPIGAVPLSQYLGVADLERLEHWVREMARILASLKAQGVSHAPIPELCLVKGKRVWLAGAGLKELSGEPEKALAALARALAGERYPEFPLRETLERIEAKEESLEVLFSEPVHGAQEAEALTLETPGQEDRPLQDASSKPEEEPRLPSASRKVLSVDPVSEPLEGQEVSPTKETTPPEGKTPSRPRVIRIEEPEEPSFTVVEPPRPRRRTLLLGLLGAVVLLGLALLFLRPSSPSGGGYVMEFRTDPPTERAEVFLLEAPEGSRMAPGQLLLTAPGRAEFDQKGVYRLRIRVAGRDPVDYLLEVPGPPLVIKVR